MNIVDVLKDTNFGQRVAEEEGDALEAYFVETNQWRRIFNGDADVIYGPKGAGKSALYYLLLRKEPELKKKGIELIPGENPRGDTAFRYLVIDPPTSEAEFIGIWKLYILTLIGRKLQELRIDNQNAKHVISALKDAGLLEGGGASLDATLRVVRQYVRRLMDPSALETEIKLDPLTGAATGVISRIALQDSDTSEKLQQSIDSLLRMADQGLAESSKFVWLLLDRLDVAFADSKELEENALRALFKTYLDSRQRDHIKLKIFLRDDIWKRITRTGFREASHITRHLTISWEKRSLLNLIVRRAIQNAIVQKYYETSKEEVLQTVESQERFFYEIFPHQVEKGSRRPTTIDWILTRTRDGNGYSAPREVIHLLNCAIGKQLDVFDVGGYEPEDVNLVAGAAIKEALPEVSQVRLVQTIYAEYPDLQDRIDRLKGEKTSQRHETLAAIWGTGPEDTARIAEELVEIGFFEARGEKDDPEFWVPFLYRDALDMIQGSAE